jgi:hypothetical protein
MLETHSFDESVVAELFSALIKLDDPGEWGHALARALASSSDEEKARVLSRLIVADGTIADLVDPRGAMPVTFGMWLEVFRRGKASERERRELAAAIADVIGRRERADEGAHSAGKSSSGASPAVDEGTPVETAARVVDVDVRAVRRLLRDTDGVVKAARDAFIKAHPQIEKGTARDRFARAFKKIEAEAGRIGGAQRRERASAAD